MLKKILTLSLVFTLLTASLCPSDAFAARSHAGGGDLAKFDFGKWAIGTGIGVASFTLGSAIGAAIDPASVGMTDSFGAFRHTLTDLGGWAASFNVYAATKQMNRAIGAIGMYCGWDPRATLFVSSVLTSMTAGGLNFGYGLTELTLSQSMLSGAIQGAVEGGIIAAAANENGEVEPWVSALAGIAGSFAGGTYEGQIGSSLSQGLGVGLSRALVSIPTAGIRIGEAYLARSTNDRWNQYIISQSFSGLYPLVGTMTRKIMGFKSEQYRYIGGVANDSGVIKAQQFNQPNPNAFNYRLGPQAAPPPVKPLPSPRSDNLPKTNPMPSGRR